MGLLKSPKWWAVRFKRIFDSRYLIPYYRILIVRLRLFYFVRVRRTLNLLQSDQAFAVTVKHNLRGLKHCNNRIELLIKPLSVIELMSSDSKALVVGPRNEHDLYCMFAHGFTSGNVRGLDLISYSPMIDLGDVHAAPYADDSFDTVVVGWTLSYSRNPRGFAEEIVRITRSGGIVAIGLEYSVMSEEDAIAVDGYAIQEYDVVQKRINSVEDILGLFEGHVAHTYFSHDAPARRVHTRERFIENCSNVAVIFSIHK